MAAFTFSGAVSNGSSMIWNCKTMEGATITLEVTTRFFRVSNKRPNKKQRPISNFLHESRLAQLVSGQLTDA